MCRSLCLSCWPTGRQSYAFPNGCTVAAGASVSIRSGPSILEALEDDHEEAVEGTLIWTQRHVWDDKGDAAVLHGPGGVEVARCTATVM
jgi:hypothetical protein